MLDSKPSNSMHRCPGDAPPSHAVHKLTKQRQQCNFQDTRTYVLSVPPVFL